LGLPSFPTRRSSDLAEGRAMRRGGAVDGVAEHGQPHVGQVDADLVLAAGGDPDLQEGRSWQALDHPPAGEGRPARLAGPRYRPRSEEHTSELQSRVD